VYVWLYTPVRSTQHLNSLKYLEKDAPLMEIRVCPECNKAFYASSDTDMLVCTYCGHVLYDGKSAKRSGKRVRKDLKFRMSVKSGTLPAKLIDYSSGGLKAVYKGSQIEADTILEVDIDELKIHTAARAIWTHRVSKDLYESGFKFLN